MPIDPNISLQVNNEVLPGPLEMLTRIDSLRKLKNENLLFRMNTESAEAAGKLYQENILPDGTLDEAGFMRGIANNPATAWKAGDYLAQMFARRKEQNAIEKSDVENERARLTLFGDVVGGLAALGNDVTKQDVWAAAGRLIKNFPTDKKMQKTLLAQINAAPEGGPELQKWIEQQQLQVMTAKERFDLTNPAPLVEDRGGVKTVVQVPRAGDQTPRVLMELDKTPTPQDLNAPQERRGPRGEPLPPAPRIEVAPTYTGQGKPYSIPKTETANNPLGPPPAEVEGDILSMKQFREYRDNLDKQATAGEQTIIQIESMRKLMEEARIGAGAEWRGKAAAWLQSVGAPDSLVSQVQGGASDSAALAAYQAFAKKTFDQAYESLKSMTPSGTQLTQGEVMAKWETSPRPEMDPRAVQDLFNYATQMFKYKQEEREFLDNYDGPVRGARAAWTREAIKRGFVKPEEKPRGGAPEFVRGSSTVPPEVTARDVPPGREVRLRVNGEEMTIRNVNGKLERVK